MDEITDVDAFWAQAIQDIKEIESVKEAQAQVSTCPNCGNTFTEAKRLSEEVKNVE